MAMKALVSAEIEAYAEAHSVPESGVCRVLRQETCRAMECPQMLVGPLEGAFLKITAQLVHGKRELEDGMFTGYSALCFAEAIPEGGRVTTCEIDEALAAVALSFFRTIATREEGLNSHGPGPRHYEGTDRPVRLDFYR
jgi:predicted O-methyltransferase YrrM